MRKHEDYKIGTLIHDMGRMAVVTKKIQKGDTSLPTAMSWCDSYQLTYTNGDVCIFGAFTLKKLIMNGQMQVIAKKEDKDVK